MKKTIEELAKQYAEDICLIEDYCNGVDDEQRKLDLQINIDEAKFVLSWLFLNKPLTSRMTIEEKERVRKEYAKTYPYDIDRGVTNMCIENMLERIFGKELFESQENFDN